MLDTNVLSAIVRDPYGPVATRVLKVGVDTVCCSIVVAGELRFGAVKRSSSDLSESVERVLSLIEVIPLGPRVDHVYASLRAELESRGETIGSNDTWIASHALDAGMTLVTDNLRHFERVENLEVENWIERDG